MNFWNDPLVGIHTPLSMIVASLLLSFALGQVISWFYILTHRGMTWSRNIIHSMVLLSMMVTMVMLVVGDSVARAFGLIGALSIVRFRTVVRDVRDTTYVFMAVGVGIAVGVHQPLIAVVATLLVGLAATLLHYTRFAARYVDSGVLRLRATLPQGKIEQLVSEWCSYQRLLKQKPLQGDEVEYSFEIRLLVPGEQDSFQAFLKESGLTVVALTMEEGAEEW
jgi:uncharacterized membrane protein YhiD involved in acid resistance